MRWTGSGALLLCAAALAVWPRPLAAQATEEQLRALKASLKKRIAVVADAKKKSAGLTVGPCECGQGTHDACKTPEVCKPICDGRIQDAKDDWKRQQKALNRLVATAQRLLQDFKKKNADLDARLKERAELRDRIRRKHGELAKLEGDLRAYELEQKRIFWQTTLDGVTNLLGLVGQFVDRLRVVRGLDPETAKLWMGRAERYTRLFKDLVFAENAEEQSVALFKAFTSEFAAFEKLKMDSEEDRRIADSVVRVVNSARGISLTDRNARMGDWKKAMEGFVGHVEALVDSYMMVFAPPLYLFKKGATGVIQVVGNGMAAYHAHLALKDLRYAKQKNFEASNFLHRKWADMGAEVDELTRLKEEYGRKLAILER